jgi:hypothetical protein
MSCALQLASAIAAFVAAFFWFRSAMMGPIPEVGWGGGGDWQVYMDRMSRRNRWGAGCAGIAALLQGASLLFPSCPSLAAWLS